MVAAAGPPRLVFLLLLASLGLARAQQCDSFKDNERFDCYPDPGSNQQGCQARGCCWQEAVGWPSPRAPMARDVNVPYCFFPRDFPSYTINSVNTTDNSSLQAFMSRSKPSGWPSDVPKLKLSVVYETASRLRVRIEDANNKRWEPPLPLAAGRRGVDPANSDFQVTLRMSPFGLRVVRKRDGRALLDTVSVSAPLIFADQFIQLSSRLPTTTVYGIGEQRRNFTHDLSADSAWERIALWTRDEPPTPKVNLYGVHNFMLGLLDDGSAFGLFLLNSNAQEVLLQPLPAITYRTIGGILDLFVFSGPTPMDVVQQYNALIGRPMMPPYWSLGFHLSRYGFKSVDEVRQTLARNLAAKMPLDVMWNDIDYMDSYKDWTYDKINYKDLPGFTAFLHNMSLHYVIIVDPGISNQEPGKYPPYDQGLMKGVFIKKADGSAPLVGKVWPGETVYPDFTNPAAEEWWYDQASAFHAQVPYDGLWIDMNEPSNFVDGSLDGCPTGNPLDFPPYTPWVLGDSLIQKTVCPSALQNLSSHYNLHNMYGYFEAKATNAVLQKIRPNKRLFILTRSSFAGSGRYTFHWTGDNQATWDNMHYSIGQVLNFNLFGIPMVGADICGFLDNSNQELCTRWMQLGAFYPFMRNHNTLGARDQDPAVWNTTTQAAMRSALRLRYSLLPYLYTQLFLATATGSPVARPLFMEFPSDAATHKIDSQFLLGPALLVSPVLAPGATSVAAYLPDARWCDVQTGEAASARGQEVTLDAPIDRINVHLRGGHLLLTKPPAPNTAAQKSAPYGLRACLDDTGAAQGELFADDGEAPLDRGSYNRVRFAVSTRVLVASPEVTRGGPISLGSLWLSGVKGPAPTKLMVNGQLTKFMFDTQHGLLVVPRLSADLLQMLTITWE